MKIGGRREAVGDDAAAGTHRAMIEVEEALGLALAQHIADFGIRAADLGLFDGRLPRLVLKRLLVMGEPVLVEGLVERL